MIARVDQIKKATATDFDMTLAEFDRACQQFVNDCRQINNFINMLVEADITIQEVKMDFDLSDYKPKTIDEDSFDSIVTKKQLVTATVNYARIETYDGDKADLQGRESFAYELQIKEDPQNKYVGRKLWKRVWLDDTAKLKKLADSLFTCFGVEFSNKDQLQAACANIVDQDVLVRAWSWKPEDSDRELQMHSIKPLTSAAKDSSTKATEVAF